jgi:hypothetical protein
MIISPQPYPFAGRAHANGSKPQPSSTIVSRVTSGSVSSVTVTFPGRAYLATFPRASCAMRKSVSSVASGRRRGDPFSMTDVATPVRLLNCSTYQRSTPGSP